MNANNFEHIDVDAILKDKSPRLYRWVPRFGTRFIGRLIHQKEINYVLSNYSHLKGVDFIDATLGYMQVEYRVHGIENLNPEGRYIFASNHPLGGLDGLILASAITKHLGDTKLIVNDILMNLEPLQSIFIPVNKHGGQKPSYAKLINTLYESPSNIIYFPAGLCSRKTKGRITELPWKKNFVTKAIDYGRDIVPVYVAGRNSAFFYNLALLRTKLGVKSNLEMLLLPDEMFRKKGVTIDMYFGKPIKHEELSKNFTTQQWADIIRQKVEKIENNNQTE